MAEKASRFYSRLSSQTSLTQVGSGEPFSILTFTNVSADEATPIDISLLPYRMQTVTG